MTPLEFIRLRLSEAEREPITPAESMLIDAVCALSDHVESRDAGVGMQSVVVDVRRLMWCSAYALKLHAMTARGENERDCRTTALAAANAAVAALDDWNGWKPMKVTDP